MTKHFTLKLNIFYQTQKAVPWKITGKHASKILNALNLDMQQNKAQYTLS